MNDFGQTDENIRKAGMDLFLSYGFQKTSLRELCKAAGITTGGFYRHYGDKESLFHALVIPAITKIEALVREGKAMGNKAISQGKSELIWTMDGLLTEHFVQVIYSDFNCFKLLFTCAQGTRYENYIHTIAIEEAEIAETTMERLRGLGQDIRTVRLDELHVLAQAELSAMLEVVVHEFTREKAVKYMKTIEKFYSAGWKALYTEA